MTRIFNSETECSNEVKRLKLLQKRPFRIEVIPSELANSSQWIVWSYEVGERKNGKFGPDKIAYQARNPRLKSSRWHASDWSDLATALQCVKDNPHIDGIGYFFSENDGLIGVDFDNCRDPKTGETRKEYQFWIDKLNGYTEVSPSGTGIKVWVRGTGDSRCFRNDEETGFRIQNFADGIIEIYRRGQYFTVTTQVLEGFKHIKPAQDELDVLSEFYLSRTHNTLSEGWVSGEHVPDVVDGGIPAAQPVTVPTMDPESQLDTQSPHILEERASLCQCEGCLNCSLSRYPDQCDRSRKAANFESCSKCRPYQPTELYKLCSACYQKSPDQEKIIEKAVEEYFSTLGVQGFYAKTGHVIQFGSLNGIPDVVLIKDNKETLAAIAECKGAGYVGSGIKQLKSYLSATHTRFGVFANRVDIEKWEFYENQRRSEINKISRDEFEDGIVRLPVIRNRLRYEVSSLELQKDQLMTDSDLLSAAIQNGQQQLEELETKTETLQQIEIDRQTTCQGLAEEINQLNDLKPELQSGVDQLRGEVQSLESLKAEQVAEIESLNDDEQKLNVKIQRKNTQLGELEVKIRIWNQTEREGRDTCKKLEKETKQINHRKSELENEVGTIENLISKLRFWRWSGGALVMGALVVCFIVFLTQRSATENAPDQFTQKESEIQRLITSVEQLEESNEGLNREKDRLQEDLKNSQFAVKKKMLKSDSCETIGQLHLTKTRV